MDAANYLSNHFLIAMPGLADPNFFHTVTYICEHNPEGALGIVINRPLETRLSEILEQLDIPSDNPGLKNQFVFQGGPVQPERGFVLHQPLGNWDATLKLSDSLGLSSSLDVLGAIARGEGPSRSLVALGYAGWGAGQLEREMAENAWLSGPASEEILFDLPVEKRWEAAAALLGVDLKRLSGEVGHG